MRGARLAALAALALLSSCEPWESAEMWLEVDADGQRVVLEARYHNLARELAADCGTRERCLESLRAIIDPETPLDSEEVIPLGALLSVGEVASVELVRSGRWEVDGVVRYEGPLSQPLFEVLGFRLEALDGELSFLSEYWAVERPGRLAPVAGDLDGEAVSGVALGERPPKLRLSGGGSEELVPLLLALPGLDHTLVAEGLLPPR